jgi:hypothetical protein
MGFERSEYWLQCHPLDKPTRRWSPSAHAYTTAQTLGTEQEIDEPRRLFDGEYVVVAAAASEGRGIYSCSILLLFCT